MASRIFVSCSQHLTRRTIGALGAIVAALMLCALLGPTSAYGADRLTAGLQAQDSGTTATTGTTYDYDAAPIDTTTYNKAYPGVYKAVIQANPEDKAKTIGIPSIDDDRLADAPTTESPAIIVGSDVNWVDENAKTKAEVGSGKENARLFTDPSPSRYAPYSYFKYSVDTVKEADGVTPKKDANGNPIPKLTGFDGTYVIVRIDVSDLFYESLKDVKDDSNNPIVEKDASGNLVVKNETEANKYYLHVQQAKNNALLVAIGQDVNAKTFSNLKTEGNNQVHYKVGSYNIGKMFDEDGPMNDKPYFDVILFSSASLVSGADAQKEGALNGDVELSFYIDKQAQKDDPADAYDPSYQPSTAEEKTAYVDKYFKKYYDEEAAKKANPNLKVSRYTVMGSKLHLETMVENGDATGTQRTYWSLAKSVQTQPDQATYYDTHGAQDSEGYGTAIKLMCEVPVIKGLTLKGTADSPKKRTLDVNSFDVQVANNTSPTGTDDAGLLLENAWLKITDSWPTTGAELAIGNNAIMTITTGGKLLIDEKCQLEIEWDGATTQPAAEGQPAAKEETLNNGALDLRAGGEVINDGVVTIEGTEGKPYQPGQEKQASEADKGHGELIIEKDATFTNNGCLMPNGALYVLGTLVNNGKFADSITLNDPDRGLFTYHKGIQCTWKDDVTQQNIIYGGMYVGMDKMWKTPTDYEKAVVTNNGDIVICPGELINMATIKNMTEGAIYLCATDRAIIPVEPDPNATTPVVTKEVDLAEPAGSRIMNWGTIDNQGEIRPAQVSVATNGSLNKLIMPGNYDDMFNFTCMEAGKLTGVGYVYKHNLKNAAFDLILDGETVDSVVYNGNAQSFGMLTTFTTDGADVNAGTNDFTVEYLDPAGAATTLDKMKDAGVYTVKIKGQNAFTGVNSKTFTITPAQLSAATLSETSFTYDAKEHKPTVSSVKAGSLTPAAADYSVAYSAASPKDAGDYTATITGKGNFTGSVTQSFMIVPAEITAATLGAASLTYNAKVQKPAVKSASAGSLALAAADYTVAYSAADPKNAGAYTATVTGKGNFTGSVTQSFKIVPAEITAAALSATSLTYNAKVQKPAVKSVSAGSLALAAADYTVAYSTASPKDAGAYAVAITGKGNYKGKVTKPFTINPAKITAAALKTTSFTYNAKVHKPAVKSVKAGTLSVPAASRTVKYSTAKPKYAGTYKATITGKGNFTGAVAKKFTIKKAANPMKLKGKTVKISRAKVKKAAQTVKRSKAITVSKARGKVTYSLKSVTKASFKKYFKVNTKTGKITVKKGLKKGTYTLKVRVKAAGTSNYKVLAKTVACKVRVR